MDQPLMHLAGIAIGGYFLWIWLGDLRADADGREVKAPMAGAQPATRGWMTIAVIGAILLLGIEVAGEYLLSALGLAKIEDQTDITVLFGLYTLMAAFIEEMIFRGYLYYDRGSRSMLWGSIVVVSILFALGHPYIWQGSWPESASWWEFWRITEASLSLDLRPLAIFSTAIVFVRSLWFYFVRFAKWNTNQSLMPSILAHLATNLGVFIVKMMQGQVVGWY